MGALCLCSSGGLRIEPTLLTRSMEETGSDNDPPMFRDERPTASLELTHPSWIWEVVEDLSSWAGTSETVVGPSLSWEPDSVQQKAGHACTPDGTLFSL